MYRVYTKAFILIILCIVLVFVGLSYFAPSSFKNSVSAVKQLFSSSKTAQVIPDTKEERFEEGKQYKKLAAKITINPTVQQFIVQDQGKVQVIEFFGYACFWCQRLHPHLNEWAAKKPESIVFYRYPVYFNKGWDVLAKAYLIGEKLGSSCKLDKAFFTAIHQDHIDLGTEKKVEEFFVKQGVSQKKFQELYHSFELNRDYARANEIANAYEVIVSPAVVVNVPSGSYLITATSAGSEQAVIDIIQFLIDREYTASSSATSGAPASASASHSNAKACK